MQFHTLLLPALAAGLTLSSLPLTAQTTDGVKTIGFTTGKYSRDNGVTFTSGTKIGFALRLTKEKAALLKGATLEGVRTAFSTKQLSDFKIFVSTTPDGTPLYEQSYAKGYGTKLNDFLFDTPQQLDGSEVYVGCTFTLTNQNYAPLLFDGTSDFAPGLSWALTDKGWADVSSYGLGAPVFQLLVKGAPQFDDLVIKPYDTKAYYRSGKYFSIAPQLYNFGTEPVTSFEVTTTVAGVASAPYQVSGVNILPGETYDFEIPGVNPSTTGLTDVSLHVTKVNGKADADPSDNATAQKICIYPEDMPRRFLLENFTGQTCVNCPRGHEELNAFVKGRENDFIVVSHHAGYAPDFFTMKEDADYTWFYPSGTYAPAAMLDRAPYTVAATRVVVGEGNEGLTNPLTSALALREAEQPYVKVGMSNTYDAATRKCAVTVSVYTYNTPSTAEHRLNLWLLQDGVVAPQTGGGNSYVHDHIFRGSMTGSWGEAIELIPGETVTKTFEYTLPESILSSYDEGTITEARRTIATVPAKMSWVAFVGDATNDKTTCRIWNSASLPLAENGSTTGIDEAPVVNASAPAVSTTTGGLRLNVGVTSALVYAPSGALVATLTAADPAATLPAGVYIVKAGDAAAQRVIVR